MSEKPEANRDAISNRSMEIIIAIAFIIVAGIVMVDSRKVGTGWGDAGPESGFFPFYVGLIMMAASLVTLISQLVASKQASGGFVDREGLWHVLQVLVPTTLYVIAIPWLGLYLTSAIFLALFMRIIGGYRSLPSVLTGTATALVIFWLFEIAFKVPLPKGPLEAALGF